MSRRLAKSIVVYGLLSLFLATFPSLALAQKRLALLIGNKNYPPGVGRLINPHNDIALIGKVLVQIGFDVVQKRELERKEILAEIDAFSGRLRDAGDEAIGFFYYSGHGASNPDDRTNYLIPIGIPALKDQSAWYDTVRLEDVLLKLSKGAPRAAHVVVFDACRNELQLPAIKGDSKGFELAPKKDGMFVAYSTGANTVASDEGDGAGPYARTLADELQKPGQDHSTVFRNVARRVYGLTNKRQRPRVDDDLLALLYLNDKQSPGSNSSVVRDPPKERPPSSQSVIPDAPRVTS
jgi:uncharacterized caspase-like protein